MWSTFQPLWKTAVSCNFFQNFTFVPPAMTHGWLFDTSVQNFSWKMTLVLTLCDFNLFAKRTLAQAFMTLCNKMDDSLEMGPPPPPICLGWFCFLIKIQFTKCTIDLDPLNHMLCIDYLSIVVQLLCLRTVHLVCRQFLKCLKESLPREDSAPRTPHLGLLTWRCLNEIMTMMYFSVLQFTQCILFLFLIFIGFRYNLGKFKAPSLCVYCPGIIAMAHLSVFVISYWVFVCFFVF